MTAARDRIRVLVVEDSPSARRLLVGIVNADLGLEVIAEAVNGDEAVARAAALRPDVILMDIGLPGTDGLQATRTIMSTNPTPIVLVSANFTPGDGRATFDALSAGALTVLRKPPGPGAPSYRYEAANLATTLKLMSEVKLVRRRVRGRTAPHPHPPAARASSGARPEVIAIAASTGGPAALAKILQKLPAAIGVPILIVQHITTGFHAGLVGWLTGVGPLKVRIACDREALVAGQALVAPPDVHLGVTRDGRVRFSADPPIGGHRPSATYLFRSVAEVYGAAAIGLILTGMGNDGVAGLELIKAAGGVTIAQDAATSVVYGMPREAAAIGVDRVVALDDIAATLVTMLDRRHR